MPIVRIAALSDTHVTRTSHGALAPIFAQLADKADLVVVCGDLTDYGLPEEARVLVKELGTLRVPVITVLGNHDYESDKSDEVRSILTDAGIVVLDGESYETHDIGFAGVKGFAGGFGRGVLGGWGERAVKAFVKEAVDETLKLESALARLRSRRKIALLHYSPIRGTVEGEPLEIFPYLGCGRLEEPLTRYKVDAVFHGHAHNGAMEGRTTTGTPVYNVAMPLLRKRYPDQPPFRIIQVDTDAPPVNGVSPEWAGMERRKGGVPAPATGD